jgi:hypothetical protein
VSISTFQEKIFKSGCGVAVLVISAAAMAFSMVVGQCGRGGQMEGQNQQGPVAIQIGEVSVPAMEIEQVAQQMLQMQPDPNGGAKREAMALAQTLDGKVREVANLAVAKEIGADTSDEAIRALVTKQIDHYISDSKQRYIDAKKLKPTATEKEFSDLFKKDNSDKTPEEFKKENLDNLNTTLSNEATRQNVLNQLSPQLAMEKLKSSINVSDAELKASYDSHVMKRVMVSTRNKSAADAEAQLQKAADELKAGKGFEDVMNRYSNDLPPGAGKKVSDTVVNLSPADFTQTPGLAALKSLKPGEVSGILDVPEGKAIFKLISVKNNAPADFAKNTAKYKEQYIEQQASAEYQKRLDAIVKSDAVKFPLPGFKAIRDYYATAIDFSLMNQPGAQEKKFREIADSAKAAMNDKILGDDHAALLAWYSTVDDLYNRAKADPAKAKELLAERMESLQAVVRESESLQTRLELVDLAIEQKNSDLAVDNLINAARLNNMYDATGDHNFREIQTRLAKMKIAKLITADQVKLVEEEQQRWRTDKLDNEKAEKEFKAEQEAEKKKAALENKDFDEQQKKMAEQVKKEIADAKAGKKPN